ncbi:hypothetical protein CFC21_102387, partial [Triticum aestivum]|jgi:hypothetical protein
VDL